MITFHKLKIKNVRVDGQTAKLIEFEVPDLLKDVYRYKAGQHITLRGEIKNQEQRRSYSIYKPESSQSLCIGVRKVKDGVFSNWIFNNVEVGMEIDILPPTGNFSYIQGDQHLFFAAGCGITPIYSILYSQLESYQTTQASLFYVNQTYKSMMMLEELQDLKNKYLDRLNLYFFFSKEKQEVNWMNGRLDEKKLTVLHSLTILTPKFNDQFYICGPNAMIQDVQNYLLAVGITKEAIHFESFGLRIRDESKAEHSEIKGFKVNIKCQGKYTSLIFDGQKSFLELGLKNGLSLPFACQAGVCGTCRCKLIKGDVAMRNNNALDDYEIKAGTILSCQAYPTGMGEIDIDYDI